MVYAVVIVVVLIAVGAWIRTRKRVLPPEQFVQAVRAIIAARHPDVKVKSELDFGLECEVGGKISSLFLDNMYAQYRQAPGMLAQIVAQYLLVARPVADGAGEICWDEAKGRVLPLIKPDEYFHAIPDADVRENLVTFDAANGLRVVIVLDSEQTMRSVKKDELQGWGISMDQIRETALKNLATLTAPLWPEAVANAGQRGSFEFMTNDGYDASRIMLPDLYERVSRSLGCSRIIVTIPTRDILVAFDADKTTKERVAAFAVKVFGEGHHSVTADLFYMPK